MNLIEYKIENIKDYEKKIWEVQLCSSLCPVRIIEDNVIFDSSGYCSLKNKLVRPARSAVTEGFRNTLLCFIKIIEGKIKADDYLIDEKNLYLNPDFIFFDDKNLAHFLPLRSEYSFFDGLCRLADDCKESQLAEKLVSKNNERIMSERDLLCFLSSWELELR